MDKYNGEDYLRAEHLLKGGKYQTMTLEIENVLEGCPMMRQKQKYEGLGLKFKGAKKVLGLVKTNESLCSAACGESKPEDWIGRKVTLEVREVRDPNGGTTPAIRIIPPKGTAIRTGLVRHLGKAYT